MLNRGTQLLFPHVPQILVVDDDVVFGKIVGRIAELGGIPLTFVHCLKSWDWSSHNKFDVVIVDYDLGHITGLQLIRSVENFCRSVPTILISSHLKIRRREWPSSIVHFLHKSEGPQRILATALCAHQRNLVSKLE